MVKNLASGADQLYQILFLSCEYLLSQSRFVLALNSAPFLLPIFKLKKKNFQQKAIRAYYENGNRFNSNMHKRTQRSC